MHVLLKIVRNSVSKLDLFLMTSSGLDPLALHVLAHSGFRLWLGSISDETPLPEIRYVIRCI